MWYDICCDLSLDVSSIEELFHVGGYFVFIATLVFEASDNRTPSLVTSGIDCPSYILRLRACFQKDLSHSKAAATRNTTSCPLDASKELCAPTRCCPCLIIVGAPDQVCDWSACGGDRSSKIQRNLGRSLVTKSECRHQGENQKGMKALLRLNGLSLNVLKVIRVLHFKYRASVAYSVNRYPE